MMAFVLPDPGTAFGARVDRRLHGEMTAWITSVDAAGTPQPAPVWFVWDDETATALLYSEPTAKRLPRMRANPRTSLHLNDNEGADVVVLTGTLAEAPDAPPPDRNQPYLDKYGAWITRSFGTAKHFATLYSIPLRFHPTHLRGH